MHIDDLEEFKDYISVVKIPKFSSVEELINWINSADIEDVTWLLEKYGFKFE